MPAENPVHPTVNQPPTPAENPAPIVRVGLVSDTHGVLDPRVLPAFRAEGVSAIMHAGDIGADHVLYELEALAPVTAVLGNTDREIPGWDLRMLARADVAGVRLLVIHDFHDLGPVPDDVDVVVCGHSHQPRNEWHGKRLVVNPGSASQRRRMPSRSIGVLDIFGDGFEARIIQLNDLGPQE